MLIGLDYVRAQQHENGLFDYIRKNILLTYDKNDQESDLDMELQLEPQSTFSNIFFTDIENLNEDTAQYDYSADYLYNNIDRNIAINMLGTTERDIFTNKTGIGITDYPLDTKQLADKYGYTTQHVNRLYRAAEQKVLDIIQSA